MKFHVDACPPRQPQRKGKVERRVRDQRVAIDPYGRSFRDLAELQALDRRAAGGAGARSGAARRPARRSPRPGPRSGALLTPLPETAAGAVRPGGRGRPVGRDGLVAFEGRQYSVPFRLVGETVEVRGVAGAVQVLKDCAVVACHPRGTARRLVIDQRALRRARAPSG